MKSLKIGITLVVGVGMCLQPMAFAQESSSQEATASAPQAIITVDNAYQPDEQVTDFDVKTAYITMQDLQASVDGITQQLYELDAKERT